MKAQRIPVFKTYIKLGLRLKKASELSVCFKIVVLSCFSFFIYSCADAQNPSSVDLYFPPNESMEWDEISWQELNWEGQKLEELLVWLPGQGTRAFLILKDGKIVVEEYWGEKLTGLGEMDQDSFWYWASAGKTLTAALVGIAEEQKLLKRKDRSQNYLGKGWTSMPDIQEREIRLEHHLNMTTGLDDAVADPDDTNAESLTFLAEPGTRWAYHNAPYTLLEKVIEEASGKTFQAFFREALGDKIGMKGFWQQTGKNNVFYSDARTMARFGLLMQAEGNWNGVEVWSSKFFQEMKMSSQELNPSYGYLTWLNGKSSFRVPQSQRLFPGMLIPSAPADMYQAMGKNGQFLMVVPSEGLVIVRMGAAGDNALVPFTLIRDIWGRLSGVLP